jgi:hypothetical protein
MVVAIFASMNDNDRILVVQALFKEIVFDPSFFALRNTWNVLKKNDRSTIAPKMPIFLDTVVGIFDTRTDPFARNLQ